MLLCCSNKRDEQQSDPDDGDAKRRCCKSRKPDRFKEFAQETGIHGVQQISQATRTWEKAFWLFMVVVALCFLLKGIITVLQQYANQETLTNVGFLSPNRFPNISLCPGQFVNESKLIEHGFGPEDFIAFGGLFQNPTGSYRKDNLTEEQIDRFLQKVTEKFSDIDELVRAVAFDPNGFVWRAGLQSGGEDHELHPTTELTADGVCYKVHQGANITLTHDANLLIVLKRTPRPFNISASQFGYADMRIGDLADYHGRGSGIGIPQRFSYMVNLKAMEIRKVANCEGYSRVESWECDQKIHEACCSSCGKLPFYHPGRGYTILNASNHLREDLSCARVSRSCYHRCLGSRTCQQPCQTSIYEANSWFMGEPYPDMDMMFFKMPSQESSLAIQEVYAVSLQNLVGNIGGLLGLWTGSSILTAIQVVVFCCSRSWKKERRESSAADRPIYV